MVNTYFKNCVLSILISGFALTGSEVLAQNTVEVNLPYPSIEITTKTPAPRCEGEVVIIAPVCTHKRSKTRKTQHCTKPKPTKTWKASRRNTCTKSNQVNVSVSGSAWVK